MGGPSLAPLGETSAACTPSCHLPPSSTIDTRPLTTTIHTRRYASISNHMGIETSRRDDLESIGYILIYFLVGKLPWQGLRAGNTAQKHQLILDKKMSTSIENLCVGCPRQFADYMRYCRALKFDAKPNIAYLRGLFRDLHKEKYNSEYTFEWDWERQPDRERRGSKQLNGSGGGGGEGGAAAVAVPPVDGALEGPPRRANGAAEDGAGGGGCLGASTHSRGVGRTPPGRRRGGAGGGGHQGAA